ncbi:MAG: ComF family protein [Acidobacteria bacterium]|nr:ComF family protein [Acidobacteriota bacterium]
MNDSFSPLCITCNKKLEKLKGPCCRFCGVPLPGSILIQWGICSSCRSLPPPYDVARAYGPYEGRLRAVIREFKFHGWPRLSIPLASLLEEAGGNSDLFPADWILAVPLHPRRRRERGFDQTLLLAKALSTRLKIPVFTGLRRVRWTQPQFGLEPAARQRNVDGAFQLCQGEALGSRRLILIDDVLTSGATVSELSRLLRTSAKPERISVLTLARTPALFLNGWRVEASERGAHSVSEVIAK